MSSDLERQIKRLERRSARDRAARKSAETLLEDKSRALYDANRALEQARVDLERLVEQRTIDLQRRTDYTQILFTATANTSKPISEQLDDALGLATEALQLDRGVVSQVLGERYFVQHAYTSPKAFELAATVPPLYQAIHLRNTFSSITLEMNDVFAIEHVSQSPWASIRGLGSTQIETYIGTPIVVHGEVYGTLAFASPKLRIEPFDSATKDFVTLMARWVGAALERKLADIALHDRQGELRKLSHVASRTDNIVVITDGGGYIEWTNDSFTTLTGYSPDEVVGKRPGDILQGPETDPETVEYMRQCLLDQRGFKCELINYGKRGDPYWVAVEVQPVHDETGELINFIAIERDITRQREVEAALRQAKKEAEEANVAKSQFLANMSHEIRTPMNAIIGMAGLLMDTELSDEQLEFASTIRVAGESLLTIINEILDFSKIEAGKMELEEVPFNIRSCIEDALDLVATTAGEKKLDLAYFIEQDTPATIVSDVTRLRQVLVNLLSNAIKFTEQGEVVVTLKPELIGGDRWRLHFAVRDSGIGIPDNRVKHLFKPFTQVDASTTRKYGGSGLGLVICKRICELMGGDIIVESELGIGSTFKFNIIVMATDAAKVPILPDQFDLTNRHLLIVDDNATNRFILRRYAESWGMRYMEADSGTAALKLLDGRNRFDVAILDVHMPEMDGLELAQRMKRQAHTKNIPIIILSSTGRAELTPHQADIVAYLNKPLKPSQLLNALATIFAEQPQLHNQAKRETLSEFDRSFAEHHPLQILLAEDNRVNQLVATRMLGRLGYRIDVAANGLEVLDALERQPYDVVLMDIQMPEMDGVEATRQIVERYSAENRPTIVALTANALQGDREYYLSIGMDFYMSKPIRVNDLTATLEAVQLKFAPQDVPRSVDMSIVEDQFGEDADMMMEMLVPMFVEDSLQQLIEITETLAAGDLSGTAQVAHAIKGSSASLGATRLADAASELETAGKQGNLVEAHASFVKVQTIHQETLDDELFKKWL